MTTIETFKNREMIEVGARVKHTGKIDSGRRGTVVGHTRGWAGEMIVVQWDDFECGTQRYATFEVKEVRE